MPITTVGGALDQLERCRNDWETAVRARRAQARELLAGAAATAVTVREADREAVAFLTAAIANAATSEGLKSLLRGRLALHAQTKQDQAAEE